MARGAGDGGAGLGRWARRLLGVVLPVQCVGCGVWDVVLCPDCEALAGDAAGVPSDWGVMEVGGDGHEIGVWSLGDYAGPLRRIVLAAKHRERVRIEGFLVRAGRTLGGRVAASGLVPRAPSPPEVWVVPAPSGWRRRFRGQMIAPVVARGVAEAIADRTLGRVRVISCARLRAGARSQSGRTGAQRRSGRAGALVASVAVPPGVTVVLVDDVITTGATIRELARVCGPGTVAAVALCRVGRSGGPGEQRNGTERPDTARAGPAHAAYSL